MEPMPAAKSAANPRGKAADPRDMESIRLKYDGCGFQSPPAFLSLPLHRCIGTALRPVVGKCRATREMANFGNLTAQTGTGDADGDGTSNRAEFLLGLSPVNSAQRFSVDESNVVLGTTATYTDNAPPPLGHAFYRIFLTTP
jgi:hypothetical protein